MRHAKLLTFATSDQLSVDEVTRVLLLAFLLAASL
jgi:hypothetical protein